MMNVFQKIISQVEAELESSEKFMREYDDGIAQKAYYSGMAHILYIIQKEVNEHNNGWIPCSEMLPKEYGEYLCCDKYGEYIIGFPAKRVSSDDFYVETENEIMNDCIAWKNLPQPYKERDTNGN